MKTLQKIQLSLALAVIVSLLISSIGLASSYETIVTPVQAKQAALQEITQFHSQIQKWNRSLVPVHSNTYYLLDNQPAVYEFTVTDQGESAGYILVSARKDWMPILEVSDGLPPSSHIAATREIAISKGLLDMKDESEPVIYYWGSLTYSVQFGNKMKTNGIAIHLPTGKLQTLPKTNPQLKNNQKEAKISWQNLLQENTDNLGKTILNTLFGDSVVQATARYSKGISSEAKNVYFDVIAVPKFYQGTTNWGHGDDRSYFADAWPDCVGYDDDPWQDWDGCAPIAGAMVLGYWSLHGYPNIPSPALGETEDILIDHCHYYMGTSYEGATDSDDIQIGTEQVANTEYNYSFDSEYTGATWEWVLYELYWEYHRPFILAMNDYPTPGSNHAVCVFGYIDEAGTVDDKLHINNTWDQSDCFIAWNSWSSATITTVVPGN